MSILQSTAQPLQRHDVDLGKYQRDMDEGDVRDACATLYGQRDLELIRAAMIKRFARVLKRETNPDSGESTAVLESISTQMDVATKAAIINGQFEIIRIQPFNNIVGQTATLFSESGLRYEYSDDKTGETISDLRLAGGANMAAQRWDTIAAGVGSCLLYLSVRGPRLVEEEIRPTAIWAVFAGSITDGEDVRSVNGMDIDEATVVVLALSTGGYAAWFGPSTEYPMGRHVLYGGDEWSDIPDPGSPDAREHTRDNGFEAGVSDPDRLSNPLSQWADIRGRHDLPVYPFAVLYGSPLSTGLIPTSTSLYLSGLEIDLAVSLIMGAAGRGSRGAQKLTRKDNADTEIPENTTEGLIVLGRNVDLTQVGWSPTHAKAAMEVMSDITKKLAEANHVPGYLAVSNDSAAPPSGIAIARLAEPMTRYRRKRADLNRTSVLRRFEIEKALINSTVGTSGANVTIPEDTTETWNPGGREFTIDPLEKTTEWEARIKAGEATILDMIKDLRGFDSDAAALEWATERKALLEENAEVLDYFKPAASAAPAKTGGLFGGRK